MTGTVINLQPSRGFGFVKADAGREYIFLSSQLRGGLVFNRALVGARVRFELEPNFDPRGPHARRLRPAID